MCKSRTSDKTLCNPYQLSSSLVRGHITQTPPMSFDDLRTCGGMQLVMLILSRSQQVRF